MSNQQPSSHERRLHELDHNVERIFDVRKRLGKGAYGIVWKATDKRQRDTVALKKIFDAFRDDTDAQRTYREVIFLRAFRHHPNIIRLLDIYKAANNLDFYLVFEFMESDLHNVIKKGDILKDIHKRFVMYQLINAIKYMHSGNVIHRDLKPSNILIDSKCRLKVADFGLARTLSSKRRSAPDYDCKEDLDNEAMLTDYVATRWYRAPEILVASRKYTKGIDMWSLGCILGEMIRQKPLFQGTSTVNQIEKIVNALPDVTPRDIESIGASFGTVLLSKKITRDRRCSLDEMLCNSCDDALNLIKGLLVLDPDARLTAKSAISHSYVNRFRTASAEMEMRTDVRPPLQDDVRYGVEEYRTNLYDMIIRETRASAAVQEERESNRGEMRSVSMTRSRAHARHANANAPVAEQPASTNPFGVSTIRRDYTQAWSDLHSQNEQQIQQEHQHGQQRHTGVVPYGPRIRIGSPMTPPFESRPTRRSLAASMSSAASEPPPLALRRELAAVAATAPRSATSLWQAPVSAQQVSSMTLIAMPTPPPPPPPPSLPLAPADCSMLQGAERSHSHVRLQRPSRNASNERWCNCMAKPQKCKHRQRCPDGKEAGDGRQRTKLRSGSICVHEQQLQQQPAGKPQPEPSEHSRLSSKRASKQHAASHKAVAGKESKPCLKHPLEQSQQSELELTSTLESLQMNEKSLTEAAELRRRREQQQQHRLQAEKLQMRRIAHEASQSAQRLFNEQLQLDSVKQLPSGSVKQLPLDSGKSQSGAHVSCYQSRISYLEREMEKCKAQLVSYVQDNRELLSHRAVRFHLEQLQKTEHLVMAKGVAKSPQIDSGISLSGGSSGTTPKAELYAQQQLQLREFLMRDEPIAYDLPEVPLVYRAKSYQSMLQLQQQQQQLLASTDVGKAGLAVHGLRRSDSCITPHPSSCPAGTPRYPPGLVAMHEQQQQQRPSRYAIASATNRMQPEDIQEAHFYPALSPSAITESAYKKKANSKARHGD